VKLVQVVGRVAADALDAAVDEALLAGEQRGRWTTNLIVSVPATRRQLGGLVLLLSWKPLRAIGTTTLLGARQSIWHIARLLQLIGLRARGREGELSIPADRPTGPDRVVIETSVTP
jgi:hypothetical protein